MNVGLNILTSNENATPKSTSITQDILNMLSQRISVYFMNAKYRHHIDFIRLNMNCPHFSIVLK